MKLVVIAYLHLYRTKNNKMQKVKIDPFSIIGISIRTTNENGKSANDIADLWNKFMSENILDKIPNKIDSTIYSKSFEGGDYMKTNTKGDLMKGIVVNKWMEIWAMNLERKFTADFEVYGEKAQNPSNAEVDFLIAIK